MADSGEGISVGRGHGSSGVNECFVIEDHLHLHGGLGAIQSVLRTLGADGSKVEVNVAQSIPRGQKSRLSRH